MPCSRRWRRMSTACPGPHRHRSGACTASSAGWPRPPPTVLSMAIVAPDGRLVVSSDAADRRAWGDAVRTAISCAPSRRRAAAGPTYISAVVVNRLDRPAAGACCPARPAPDGRGRRRHADDRLRAGLFRERSSPAIAETARHRLRARPRRRQRAGPLSGPVSSRRASACTADDPSWLRARASRAGRPRRRCCAPARCSAGFRLLAVRRAGAYPLLIAHSLDPAVVRQAWLRQMLPLAVGGAVRHGAAGAADRAGRSAAWPPSAPRWCAAPPPPRRPRRTRRPAPSWNRACARPKKSPHSASSPAGVAHDFNNLLQSVLASAEALTQPGLPPEEVRSIGALILRVGERGMALTRRMLDYARHDDLPGGDTDVAASLRDVGDLLARSLGPGYTGSVRWRRRRGAARTRPPGRVRDRGHQPGRQCPRRHAARAARSTSRSRGMEETRPRAESGLTPGRYVRVAVTDTGRGMDARGGGARRRGVLHHQAARPGHRARPVDGPRLCPPRRRQAGACQRAGGGDHGHAVVAGGVRGSLPREGRKVRDNTSRHSC